MKILGIDFDGFIHDCIELYNEIGNEAKSNIGQVADGTVDEVRKVRKLPQTPEFEAFWTEYLKVLAENRTKMTKMVSGTETFLAEAKTRYDKVYVISGSPDGNIKRFFEINKSLKDVDGVFHVRGKKFQKLIDLGVTTYAGDMVADGEDALAAGARFIGVFHDASFDLEQYLHEFKKMHPDDDIHLAKNLLDAVHHFE